MTDAAVVGRLLDEYHDRSVAPTGVRRLSGSARGDRVTYQVNLASGSSHVIRAFQAGMPVPIQGRLDRGLTVADWLLGRARTLAYLEQAGFPAPRPVLTRTGELIGVAGPWLSWATTFVPGETARPTPDQLRMLGAALGQLHSLPSSWSSWPGPDAAAAAIADPAAAVPGTLARLDAVAPLVPVRWQPLCTAFRHIVEAVLQGTAIAARSWVHGNAWARNLVQDGPDSVTLIDWETAGMGVAVLDLGHCLMECHLDAARSSNLDPVLPADRNAALPADLQAALNAAPPDDQPQTWRIEPDERRISPLVSGYATRRTLSAAELALLPAAVTFSTAVVGAIHLEAALRSGARGPGLDARIARLSNRQEAGAAIAAIALRQLAAG